MVFSKFGHTSEQLKMIARAHGVYEASIDPFYAIPSSVQGCQMGHLYSKHVPFIPQNRNKRRALFKEIAETIGVSSKEIENFPISKIERMVKHYYTRHRAIVDQRTNKASVFKSLDAALVAQLRFLERYESEMEHLISSSSKRKPIFEGLITVDKDVAEICWAKDGETVHYHNIRKCKFVYEHWPLDDLWHPVTGYGVLDDSLETPDVAKQVSSGRSATNNRPRPVKRSAPKPVAKKPKAEKRVTVTVEQLIAGDYPEDAWVTVEGDTLRLERIEDLTNLPTKLYDISFLKIERCNNLTSLPELPQVTRLWVESCDGLTSLPELPQVTWLKVWNCNGLTMLPELLKVSWLAVGSCDGLTCLPELPQVTLLSVSFWDGLTSLPELPQVTSLSVSSCNGVTSLPELPQVTELWVDESLISLPELPRVTKLVAFRCKGLTSLPDLSQVTCLEVTGCEGLTSLPELPQVTELEVVSCNGLTSLPELRQATRLQVWNCNGLTSLPELPQVTELNLRDCNGLTSLPEPRQVTNFSVSWCDGLHGDIIRKAERRVQLNRGS